MDFDELIERFGGVIATHQLLAAGETTASIRRALRSGALLPIRHGWYRTGAADADVVAAVSDHGVVSCASALRRHGLWTPDHPTALHSRLTRHQRRSNPDRCRRYGRPTPADGAIDDVATALQYAARCYDVEGFIILCDSALNSGKITPERLRADFGDAPAFIQRAVAKTHRLAASGTETAARVRLRNAGLRVRVQHQVPGVGWIDLLVGDRLALELDSIEHHTGIERYEKDRIRDRKLVAQGYFPLRLTYAQVFDDWDATYADIADIIGRGHHRSRAATWRSSDENHPSETDRALDGNDTPPPGGFQHPQLAHDLSPSHSVMTPTASFSLGPCSRPE
ncbi:type IV toxin-antitoxin system AbiEi family antitoxin domain-containing protein [Gordonia sp. 'Campus']|uniref:type IV toxin-antitoxin system AbiEi family antitoxin domain-containing protein n=1 Tax=Gordonia sp. 'Campus' TaxID=2915824 RepID=UPI001EE414B5|nr:type IV toxin-antitoxin system AbiEi family antitoxin domain-containing protein [Gordonia sp. 'Campus']